MAETPKKTKTAAKPKSTTAKPKSTAARTTVAKPQPVAEAATPSREEIARLAHKFWAERGGHHGLDKHDWLRAEQELRGIAS